MTMCEIASHMYKDFDREDSWENPGRARIVQLVAKHGQMVVGNED
ncbi:MAG: hypothetical protein ACJAXR_002167 [Halopseudomonas sp.]|jgi:hypothetical protein